ncbi:hypothetical protein [Thermodesulforhabdus norvegica]|uniref:hypothetical protein n=1 Tax=Thermodesulforhabdus norvegica TaxID=39841 RepID=UPI0015A6FB4A|nr:hypothetical protein [Thermodesulforhabdus norvegica]
MNRVERELERKLNGYADFLRRRRLALSKHQPHLVRWVREFLIFSLVFPVALGSTFTR